MPLDKSMTLFTRIKLPDADITLKTVVSAKTSAIRACPNALAA